MRWPQTKRKRDDGVPGLVVVGGIVQSRAPRASSAASIRAATVASTDSGTAEFSHRPDAALASDAMPEDGVTIYNLKTVHRWDLFVVAHGLIGPEEPRGPALVVAQAAVEVGMELGITAALHLREAHDPLDDWVVGNSITSWSPDNRRVRGLWTALTGDTLTDAPSWKAYAMGVQLRHAFAHRAAPVTKEQAESFVTAAEQLMGHVVGVLEAAYPPQSWGPPGETAG